MSTTTLGARRGPSQASAETVTVPPYFRWKGCLDRTVAALLLIPGLPLIGVLIVLVRLTSKGPGIFAQQRTGRDGRPFVMYKLRSMRVDAEARSGAVWSTGNDPRITPVGGILRRLHLDELPQLFNVVNGQMSLIGPRPERPEFVEVLAQEIPGYKNRLAVLPGVTGLAQINLPPDTDLNSVRRKQVLDLEYIQTASWWLDLRILLCTLLRVVGVRGERALRSMRLARDVELPAVPEPANDDEDVLEELTPDRLTRPHQAIRETIVWSIDDTAEIPRSEVAAEWKRQNIRQLVVAPPDGNASSNRNAAGPEPPARPRKPR